MKNLINCLSISAVSAGILGLLNWQLHLVALSNPAPFISAYPFIAVLLLTAGMLLITGQHLHARHASLKKALAMAHLEIEKARQCKANFLSGMSHEIRTPLNGIVGFAEVLSAPDLSKEQQQEYLAHIKTSGNLLVKLIGDILELNKAGKLDLKKESFSIKEQIEKEAALFRLHAKQKGLDFSVDIDNNLPDYLIGDAGRFSEVLLNLLSNAVKFTDKGRVGLSVTNLYEHGNEALVKLCVFDTGIGISKEHEQKIFENFSSFDTILSSNYSGSGLGLAMVKHIVACMSGTVKLVSPSPFLTPGEEEGSCFEVLIPMEIDRRQMAKVVDMESYFKTLHFDHKLSVLLVEDNLLNQKLASFILKKIGCNYDIAENGEVALSKMKAKGYDLILMDVQMPVMDGLEASRKIRSELQTDIPIIGLTANVFQEDVENCLAAGMNDHLGKPYKEEQLVRVIHKWSIAKKAV